MIAAFITAAVCLAGLLAGWLLLRHARHVPALERSVDTANVTVIIPARNEESNLPALLESLRGASNILVADDASEDATAEIAQSMGATVMTPSARPAGWKGKPWVCWEAAHAASTPLLLFMDADTRFAPGGLHRMLAAFGDPLASKALSVLPFHTTARPYEQFSIFFNVILAAGAGGFTGMDAPALFGQCMMISRPLYFAAGGHSVVREHVLENLHFAPFVRAAGGEIQTALGQGCVEMRMFPDGFETLWQSWKKGFASGADATPHRTMLLSILWLTGAAMPLVALAAGAVKVAAMFYILFALQTLRMGRLVGNYRWYAAALYPVPLFFYFTLFAASVTRRRTGRTVAWKGREV